MKQPLIDVQRDAAVWTWTLPPHPTGGVTIEFIESLARMFFDLATQTEARVLILRGDFDMGLDLIQWQALRQSHPVRVRRALQHMHRWRTHTLKTLPQALIAVVSGPCRGAALPLIEGCDLVLCRNDATFSLPAAQATWFGPDAEPAFDAPPQHEPRSLSHALTNQNLSADQAQEQGWVTFSLNAADLSHQLAELTQSLLDKDPLALQFAKETLAHVPHMNWDGSVAYTAAKFAEIKARQAQAGGPSSRANAIAGFLSGQTKPGLKG